MVGTFEHNWGNITKMKNKAVPFICALIDKYISINADYLVFTPSLT